ncbi:Tad domain-containing protein [Maribius pontilimi]|uniref:Tad domain-containing protein n=1 Tax=Palleronia pontilimi TaxID=1964209 RepID=A0A934IHV7_9RHOB|nr:pilus assembly protein TadG-related protein [Palleronia pontilimi]MBJ3763660.1 Tad domain-containing protein [Palleronia pontilimi]
MKYLRDLQDGFVLVMMLLLLPVFLGFGLILIDIGRGNNAHADLQAVVDSMALTGARELDGTSTQIADARAAMGELTNPVGMLSFNGTTTKSVTFNPASDDRFDVYFLDAIPTDDTTVIDTAWITAHNAETLSTSPEYVYVRAYSPSEFSLQLIFDGIFSRFGVPSSQPVGAIAVATSESSICEVPPLFVCNPFEFTDLGVADPDRLQREFAAGNLHGRMIRLHPGGGSTAFPGNFGFLSVDGANGTAALNDYFAGGRVPICIRNGDTVNTSPGAREAIADGLNVRFDMMPNQGYGSGQGLTYLPAIAQNVRKGFIPKKTGQNFNDCVKPTGAPAGTPQGRFGDDHIIDLATGWTDPTKIDPVSGLYWGENGKIDGVYGFPDNDAMTNPPKKAGETGTPGAYVGTDSNWNLQRYLDVNFPSQAYTPASIPSTFSGKQASRYDVYRWEIETPTPNLTTMRLPSNQAQDTGGEVAAPYCSTQDFTRNFTSITSVDPSADPRTLVAAMIDCVGESETGAGGNTDLNVNTYARIFLTRPMKTWNPSAGTTVDVEIVDLLGSGGLGSLDDLIRKEAFLVR